MSSTISMIYTISNSPINTDNFSSISDKAEEIYEIRRQINEIRDDIEFIRRQINMIITADLDPNLNTITIPDP